MFTRRTDRLAAMLQNALPFSIGIRDRIAQGRSGGAAVRSTAIRRQRGRATSAIAAGDDRAAAREADAGRAARSRACTSTGCAKNVRPSCSSAKGICCSGRTARWPRVGIPQRPGIGVGPTGRLGTTDRNNPYGAASGASATPIASCWRRLDNCGRFQRPARRRPTGQRHVLPGRPARAGGLRHATSGPSPPPSIDVDLAMLQLASGLARRSPRSTRTAWRSSTTNDLDGGLKRVVDDLTSYYLIGYSSTNAQARRPIPLDQGAREAARHRRSARGAGIRRRPKPRWPRGRRPQRRVSWTRRRRPWRRPWPNLGAHPAGRAVPPAGELRAGGRRRDRRWRASRRAPSRRCGSTARSTRSVPAVTTGRRAVQAEIAILSDKGDVRDRPSRFRWRRDRRFVLAFPAQRRRRVARPRHLRRACPGEARDRRVADDGHDAVRVAEAGRGRRVRWQASRSTRGAARSPATRKCSRRTSVSAGPNVSRWRWRLSRSPDAVSGEVLDRTGKPDRVAGHRDDVVEKDGVSWVRGEVVLSPLAAGDYVIRLSATRGTDTRQMLAPFKMYRKRRCTRETACGPILSRECPVPPGHTAREPSCALRRARHVEARSDTRSDSPVLCSRCSSGVAHRATAWRS